MNAFEMRPSAPISSYLNNIMSAPSLEQLWTLLISNVVGQHVVWISSFYPDPNTEVPENQANMDALHQPTPSLDIVILKYKGFRVYNHTTKLSDDVNARKSLHVGIFPHLSTRITLTNCDSATLWRLWHVSHHLSTILW